MKKKRSRPSKKREEKHKRRKCPYLSRESERICRKMVEKGLEGKVSSFDIEHFCKGKPINCYYFRSQLSKQ